MLTVDISSAPYVLHTWSGRPSDDDVARLRDCLEWEAEYAGPVYCFVDLRAATVPDATMMRRIGAMFREFEERRKSALLVVIVDSPLIVSMLNALRWISRPRTPEIFVRSASDAITAAEARLQALGAPSVPAELRAKLAGADRPTRSSWAGV